VSCQETKWPVRWPFLQTMFQSYKLTIRTQVIRQWKEMMWTFGNTMCLHLSTNGTGINSKMLNLYIGGFCNRALSPDRFLDLWLAHCLVYTVNAVNVWRVVNACALLADRNVAYFLNMVAKGMTHNLKYSQSQVLLYVSDGYGRSFAWCVWFDSSGFGRSDLRDRPVQVLKSAVCIVHIPRCLLI
jgi:hypothetical protein